MFCTIALDTLLASNEVAWRRACRQRNELLIAGIYIIVLLARVPSQKQTDVDGSKLVTC